MARQAAARRLLFARPATRLGRLASWLGLAFLLWFAFNQATMVAVQSIEGVPVVPIIVIGWIGLAIGLGASVLGLLAIVGRGERSALVFATLLPGLFVVMLLLGELLVPH